MAGLYKPPKDRVGIFVSKLDETNTNTVEILPNYSPFKHKKDVL